MPLSVILFRSSSVTFSSAHAEITNAISTAGNNLNIFMSFHWHITVELRGAQLFARPVLERFVMRKYEIFYVFHTADLQIPSLE